MKIFQAIFIARIKRLMTETYSFKEIGKAIFEKMSEIKNARVWSVFNHDIKIENGISLPAIIITPSNGNLSILDSCWYSQNINFTVRVIDRIQDWYSEVEDNMREIADIALTKLKELWTISRTNNDWYTVSCEFDFNRWFADTQEPFRVFEIECRFKTVQN